MSKFLDSNGMLYLWNKVKTLAGGKVDKVEGKGLSTNDYSATEKAAVADSTAARHTHANKSALDGITAAKVAAWDGAGDMLKSTYDKDGDGVVDNAKMVDGHTVAADVPAGAKFTDTTYSAATASKAGLMSAADCGKLAAFGAASTYALKTDITSMYKYKGGKASFAALPATGNTVGDVWNCEDTGMNYAWTGEAWDALGQTFEIQSITNAEIDAITA